MIRVERIDTEKTRKAQEILQKAKKTDSGYNKQEVNEALRQVFHRKCYLCEDNDVKSYEIEHLKPHKGNLDLKYEWNNLFLSCRHCNNTKSDKYEPILDCTIEDVDICIAFRKKGYWGINETFVFDVLEEREEVINTAKLLDVIYSGTTPQKKMEAANLCADLRKNLAEFKEYVREYMQSDDEVEKEDLLYYI